LRADGARNRFFLDGLPAVELFVFFQTLLNAEVFELAFVADGSEEAFAAGYILLAIEADLEAFLVVVEAGVGAELLQV